MTLLQNYPNPFNESTTVPFAVTKSGKVRLEIIDVSGRQLYTLVNENFVPGNYSVSVSRNNLTAGIFFCRLSQGVETIYRKIVVTN
jgi:hypothetical protein